MIAVSTSGYAASSFALQSGTADNGHDVKIGAEPVATGGLGLYGSFVIPDTTKKART